MDFLEVIDKRHSVRRYSDRPVERELLDAIVRIAQTAPSSRNSQSTSFVIIEDKDTIEALSQMRDYGASPLKGAQSVILVVGDTTKTDLWRENCAISATMLQLSIVDHGMASCWVHACDRPRFKDEPEGEMAEDYIRTIVDVPENCKVECVIALGYSDFEPKPLPEWDAEACVMWHK